jgi:hypothetical protein
MKHSRSWLVPVAAGVFALMVGASHPAVAYSPLDTLMDNVRETFETVWDSLTPSLPGGSSETLTPSSPADVLRDVRRTDVHTFWDDLSDAGYELAEVDTGVGLIPEVKMSFRLVRELSEADRDALDRTLEIAATREPGLIPRLQRGIVQTLLAAADLTDMHVTTLVISILPLPSAEFKMEPRDSGLSAEHDVLYRALANKVPNRPALRDLGVPLPPP